MGFGFLLPGLKLQGATCNNNKLSLSNAISTVLPLTQLRWVKQTNAEKKANVVSGSVPSFVVRELGIKPSITTPPGPPLGPTSTVRPSPPRR